MHAILCVSNNTCFPVIYSHIGCGPAKWLCGRVFALGVRGYGFDPMTESLQ